MFNRFKKKPKPKVHRNQIVIHTPTSVNDRVTIAQQLKTAEASAIVDISLLPESEVWQLIDFLAGEVFALDGWFEKISDSLILFTHSKMPIKTGVDGLPDCRFLFQQRLA